MITLKVGDKIIFYRILDSHVSLRQGTIRDVKLDKQGLFRVMRYVVELPTGVTTYLSPLYGDIIIRASKWTCRRYEKR